MKKQAALLFFLVLILFVGLSVYGYSQNQSVATAKEEIILTTYYPVPYGDYQNLRLWPSAQKECNENKRGTLYYDTDANKVMVCTLSSDKMMYVWQDLGLWAKKEGTDTIYPNDIALNVGIGGTDTQDYGKGVSKLDTYGYAAANDVWLKDVGKWVSAWLDDHEKRIAKLEQPASGCPPGMITQKERIDKQTTGNGKRWSTPEDCVPDVFYDTPVHCN